jgi:uncharacterized membrane protein
LREGWHDFTASPTHLALLCVIYPVMGLVLGRMASGAEALPMIWPLVAGFALVGPLAAVGLYDMSRQREQQLDVSWLDAFAIFRTRNLGAIILLGLMLAAVFGVWLLAARAIFAATMPGLQAETPVALVEAVLGTAAGWRLIVVGTAVGFGFALVVLVFGVVSFPLLIDRDLGPSVARQVGTALATSARAVLANPAPMLVWGLLVVILLGAGFATLLVGLAVAMPVLGHATWHLYRRLVAA